MTNGRENRNHGNQEEGEESCQEEEIAALRANEGARKRPFAFSTHWLSPRAGMNPV
jgi:hypothetical protein